jgi:hypothetical protein
LNNIDSTRHGGIPALPSQVDQEVIVDAILIFLTSLGMAYLVARLTRRGSFTTADLAIGVFCGFASLSMAQFFSAEGASWQPGLPLFVACALTLGLESLQHRSSLR